MDAKLVARYLTNLKEKSGLTYETWAEKSGTPETTLKNLCSGKTEDPRLATVAPAIYAADGSIDEMLTGKRKENGKADLYEQHRQDYKESVEKLIAEKDAHIKTLKKENLISKIFLGVTLAIFITILVAEVMNPNLGWLRY